MGGKASPYPELEDPDDEFVEIDPSGRYGRVSLRKFIYPDIVISSSTRRFVPNCWAKLFVPRDPRQGRVQDGVSLSPKFNDLIDLQNSRFGFLDELLEFLRYRGFDELEGIEIAWNQVKVSDLLNNSDDLERLYSEVHLLKTLKHKNIIKFYTSWVDTKRGNINFITEIFTSGTLRQYRMKHKHVDLRALKNWSKQILHGLHYLHSHDPPVIHRDLKCDNIFVNGNHGEVKIGDLGLATILRHAQSAHSVIGTPEFMAPELYEEDYNELVDIYAFGMCLLELVTLEYPYMECANAAQIYKKVVSGVKPASLEKVEDREVRRFIEKCIANVPDRLPAGRLLQDPFLRSDDDQWAGPSELDSNPAEDQGQDEGNPVRDFMVEGQRTDINTIFLKLRITDSTGHPRNIHFPFDIEADTSISVASEMVAELDLTHQDVTAIAAMIDAEIHSHVPDWLENSPDNSPENSSVNPPKTDHVVGNLTLERLPSGRIYWSDSPRVIPKKCYDDDDDDDDDDDGVDENGRGKEENVNAVMGRLEELLLEQEREIDEMKKKHRRAVADVLKGIPPKLRGITLGLRGLGLRDENS